MPKNISISFSGIITKCNPFNRLNRNTASRVISLFKMPIKKIINFVRFFCLTTVKPFFKMCKFICFPKFDNILHDIFWQFVENWNLILE